MIVVSILDNSIAHAHTYVIVVLCVLVAMHGHLPSISLKSLYGPWCHDAKLFCPTRHFISILFGFDRWAALTCEIGQEKCPCWPFSHGHMWRPWCPILTGISLSLSLSLLTRLPQFPNPSSGETLATADPTTEAVAAAGREDESPVLVAAHGVVEHGFDHGSRG